jgi:hypothetical protein
MKLTRRQMVTAAVAGSTIAAKAGRPTRTDQSGQTAGTSTPDFAKQAHDNIQRNADSLAKFAIPIATEPAFQFKA